MNFFRKIPTSAQALLVVLGTLAPILFMLFKGNVLVVVAVIYVIVGAVAGLGVLFYERDKKTKASDFGKSLATNAASEKGIKDPNEIAKANEMAKTFQSGIDIYKQHGKDLYSLPWYVVVGESESGKTEMIRRSDIGFPPKLTEFWQGAGGTRSMHWWFTNRAVLIDTAGRLFVSEGAEAAQPQWLDFLRMLKKNRADCPINGLILVIPASRLLTHPNPALEAASLAKLEENAGQIAKQMETLRTELGVRFPVYIMITKMDKLNGFREFFGKIERADERYQILGWSNPAPLGQTFDPQAVTEYMHTVADRLKRRMMSELRHIESENPAGLRIDDVTGLYAFPSSFESMSGKLTRYLRHIFATDEWSDKPPFLRGIYCTSALQQGKVLDEALAAAMGVPFEQLDRSQQDDGLALAGLSLSENRTYFVRDLFLDKIFNEKGLVTNSAKLKSAVSGWKLRVPASLLLILVTLGIFGLLAKDDDSELKLWRGVSECTGTKYQKDPKTQGTPLHDIDQIRDWPKFLAALEKLGTEVRDQPKLGWFLKPAQLVDSELTTARQVAYAGLTAKTLALLENAVIKKYLPGDSKPQPSDYQTLHALIILRCEEPSKWFSDKEPWTPSLLSALFKTAEIKTSSDALVSSISAAQKPPRVDFKDLLGSRREGDLKAILHGILPPAELTSRKARIEKLNEFAGIINQLKQFDSAQINKALTCLGEIPGDGQNRHGSAGRNPNSDSTALATTPEMLIEFLRANPTIAKQLDYDVSTSKLDPAAESLDKYPGILKSVGANLKILADGTLKAENIDEFKKSRAKIMEEAKDKEMTSADILKKVGDLKIDWFKHQFIEKKLRDYVCRPIVVDATRGGDDNLRFLWKLVQPNEDFAIESDKLDKLRESFELFFDFKKIKDDDILGSVRTCFARLDSDNVTNKGIGQIFAITWAVGGGKKDASWDTGLIANPNAIKKLPVSPAAALTFSNTLRGQIVESVRLDPWAIFESIEEVKASNTWIYKTPKGNTYEVEIEDIPMVKLQDRPTADLFKLDQP